MIHHSKKLDLEFQNFEYHYEPTYTGETEPSQTLNPQTCRNYKSFRQTYIRYIIPKLLTWRSQILIINMSRHTQAKLNHLKPQILKRVEFMKVSEKPVYDTSFPSSWLGDHRF